MTQEVNPKIKAEFDKAVKQANNLPTQPPEVLLEMYGLYKQAMLGDVTGKKPGRINLKARYKYEAWDSRKGMAQEMAMQAYIDLIHKLENP
ncbi:acyl-CoA-binding protein [Candidatus Hodarchaeum mangrovi]